MKLTGLAGKTIMAVTAHPDDLEWYFGGSIHQLAKKNRVVQIVASSGVRSPGSPGSEEAELGAAHRREQMAAAEILGIAETVFFDLPEGDLAYGSLSTLRVRLYRAFRNYQPQVLVTFAPGNDYDPHPDHHAVARLALEAACLHPCGKLFPEERSLTYERPEWFLLLGCSPAGPYAVNDISKSFAQKLGALRCHASRTAGRWEQIESDLTAIAVQYGAQAGAKYGEAYLTLGWVHGELGRVSDETADEDKRGRSRAKS